MIEVDNYKDSKQKWTIIRNYDNVDLDQILLQIYHPVTDELILDITWDAKDFFKKMVDLQYDYGR